MKYVSVRIGEILLAGEGDDPSGEIAQVIEVEHDLPTGNSCVWARYPCPFLNPVTAADRWVTVDTYVAVLTVVVRLLATGVIATSRRGSS